MDAERVFRRVIDGEGGHLVVVGSPGGRKSQGVRGPVTAEELRLAERYLRRRYRRRLTLTVGLVVLSGLLCSARCRWSERPGAGAGT